MENAAAGGGDEVGVGVIAAKKETLEEGAVTGHGVGERVGGRVWREVKGRVGWDGTG